MSNLHELALTPEEREEFEQAMSVRMVPSAYRGDAEFFKKISGGLTWDEYAARMTLADVDGIATGPVPSRAAGQSPEKPGRGLPDS